MDRVAQYMRMALLGGGVAVVDAELAQRLSCGLWPTAMQASMDFKDIAAIVRRYGQNALVLRAEHEGRTVIILIRSKIGAKLAERLESVTGLVFTKLKVIDPATLEPVQEQPPELAYDYHAELAKRKEAEARQIAEHNQWVADEAAKRFQEAEKDRKWREQRQQQAEESRKAHYAGQGVRA